MWLISYSLKNTFLAIYTFNMFRTLPGDNILEMRKINLVGKSDWISIDG